MTQPLRVGVIGVGSWGQKILRALQDSLDSSVRHWPTPAYELVWTSGRGWREVFDSQDPQMQMDAVIIATPASTHAEIACAAISKGLHVFLEKPAAIGLADTLKIEEAWKAATILGADPSRRPVLLVDHQYLFHPAYERLYELTRHNFNVLKGEILFGGNGPVRSDCPPEWDYGPHAAAAVIDLGWTATEIAWSNKLLTKHASIWGEFSAEDLFQEIHFNDHMVRPDQLIHIIRGPNGGCSISPVLVEDQTPPLTRSLSAFIIACVQGGTDDRRFGMDLPVKVARLIEDASPAIRRLFRPRPSRIGPW